MLEEMLAKRKLRKLIRNSNLDFARQTIINLFAGKVIPNELARRLDDFVNNPCEDTALELLKHNGGLVATFVLARKDGWSTFLYEQGDLKPKKDKKEDEEEGPII